MKRCNKCGQEKPTTEFYARQAKCKPCANETSRAWHEENREKVSIQKKVYNEINSERRNKKEKARRERKFEEISAKAKARYLKNREKILAQAKIYRMKNPDKKREQHLKSNYGITLEDYERMYADQKGVCKICKKGGGRGRQKLVVDHDHKTGRVRGLLCSNCNKGLGHAKDSPSILKRMIEYLCE